MSGNAFASTLGGAAFLGAVLALVASSSAMDAYDSKCGPDAEVRERPGYCGWLLPESFPLTGVLVGCAVLVVAVWLFSLGKSPAAAIGFTIGVTLGLLLVSACYGLL